MVPFNAIVYQYFNKQDFYKVISLILLSYTFKTKFKSYMSTLIASMYFFEGTLGVCLVGIITVPSWWLVGILTLGQGVLLLKMAQDTLLSHAYAGYIIFGTFYHIMATVAK